MMQFQRLQGQNCSSVEIQKSVSGSLIASWIVGRLIDRSDEVCQCKFSRASINNSIVVRLIKNAMFFFD